MELCLYDEINNNLEQELDTAFVLICDRLRTKVPEDFFNAALQVGLFSEEQLHGASQQLINAWLLNFAKMFPKTFKSITGVKVSSLKKKTQEYRRLDKKIHNITGEITIHSNHKTASHSASSEYIRSVSYMEKLSKAKLKIQNELQSMIRSMILENIAPQYYLDGLHKVELIYLITQRKEDILNKEASYGTYRINPYRWSSYTYIPNRLKFHRDVTLRELTNEDFDVILDYILSHKNYDVDIRLVELVEALFDYRIAKNPIDKTACYKAIRTRLKTIHAEVTTHLENVRKSESTHLELTPADYVDFYAYFGLTSNADISQSEIMCFERLYENLREVLEENAEFHDFRICPRGTRVDLAYSILELKLGESATIVYDLFDSWVEDDVEDSYTGSYIYNIAIFCIVLPQLHIKLVPGTDRTYLELAESLYLKTIGYLGNTWMHEQWLKTFLLLRKLQTDKTFYEGLVESHPVHEWAEVFWEQVRTELSDDVLHKIADAVLSR